jgi:hypothetical protein
MLLAQTPPWDRVPPSFIELVVDLFGDKPSIDAFIYASVKEKLIDRYAHLCRQDFSPEVLRAAVSKVLCDAGFAKLPIIAKFFPMGERGRRECVDAAMIAECCFDAALLFEPQQIAAYIGLAHLHAPFDRDKSRGFAKRGLTVLAQTRDTPAGRALASGASRIIPPDIDDQAERLLRTFLEQ